MKKQAILLIIFISLVICGVVGYAIWSETSKNNNNEVPIPESDISSNTTSPAVATNQEATLGVKSTQNINTAPQQASLPGPSEFKVYELYASEESSLYIDVKAGEGSVVSSGDTVAMIYKGWLTTGELFDESKINEDGLFVPFVFKIGAGQVIPGWDQGITGMSVGSKRRLIIPSTAGYGPTGQGQIPPNSMLIFDVELLQIQKN